MISAGLHTRDRILDAFTNAFSAAVNEKGDVTEALASVQEATVADLEKSGYDVAE